MKIKAGRIEKDVTAYGSKYSIQIYDSYSNDNSDLENLVGNMVSVVIGDISAMDEVANIAVKEYMAENDLKDMK